MVSIAEKIATILGGREISPAEQKFVQQYGSNWRPSGLGLNEQVGWEIAQGLRKEQQRYIDTLTPFYYGVEMLKGLKGLVPGRKVGRAGVAVGALGLLAAGCGPAAPTETPPAIVSPAPERTPTLVVVPTKEAPSRLNLSEVFLTNGLTGIGGGEKITAGEFKGSLGELALYASETWEGKIEVEDLGKDALAALKFLLAYGQVGGFKNTTYHLGEVYHRLENLRFFRIELPKLPNEQQYETVLNASPGEMIIRRGTYLSVIGIFADASGRWAAVSFSEGFDRSQKGIFPREVPRQYSTIISQDTLAELLSLAGVSYQESGIIFTSEGKTVKWLINEIDPQFAKNLEKGAGVLFMDRKPDGTWYENPVVPYPPRELVGETYGGVGKTKDGRVVATDTSGKELCQAVYQNGKWEWREIPKPVYQLPEGATVISAEYFWQGVSNKTVVKIWTGKEFLTRFVKEFDAVVVKNNQLIGFLDRVDGKFYRMEGAGPQGESFLALAPDAQWPTKEAPPTKPPEAPKPPASQVQRTEKGRYGIYVEGGKEYTYINPNARSGGFPWITSVEEECLFADCNILTREGPQPERFFWGGKITNVKYATGEAKMLNQGKEIRLLITKNSILALHIPWTTWERTDISQFAVGDVVKVWKVGAFSETEVNEVAAMWAVK